jgi:nucleotide-binding universal stress UspA family protein
MFRNIMVPLDGSHFSALALPFALRLAQKEGARVHLVRVHVPAAPTAEVIVTANYDELIRENERYWLATETDQVREAGISVQSQLLDGPIALALQGYVATHAIDLVIMTTHGRAGLRRIVLGSVAKDLIRKIDVPILFLRPQSNGQLVTTDIADLRRMVVALDGSPECEVALPYASALAQITGAELILARVTVTADQGASTVDTAYLQNLAATISDEIVARMVVLRGRSIAPAILECATNENADLIIMATHAREGWERVAHGSVAESVLGKSAAPVMLIRTSDAIRATACEAGHDLVISGRAS